MLKYLFTGLDSTAKWRAILEGGDSLKDYLERFTNREDPNDFETRKRLTYCPNYARAGLFEIKNTICRRFTDIKRSGGSDLFKEVIAGKHGGVDLKGNTLSSFIGDVVLLELLFMRRVAVMVDSQATSSLNMNRTAHPYMYIYRTEEIVSTRYEYGELVEITVNIESYDRHGSTEYLPERGERRFELTNGQVIVTTTFSDHVEETLLDLDEIPIVVFELTYGLLEDVADAQIALMNMNSADLIFGIKSNFPFYVEQGGLSVDDVMKAYGASEVFAADGTTTQTNTPTSSDHERRVGVTTGMKYGIGMDAPQFIAPPSEPLKISMEKQKEIKADIRHMLNLSLSLLADRRSSAESKMVDDRGTEAGVRSIATELLKGERDLIRIWHKYMSEDDTVEVLYPSDFELRSDSERNKEAQELLDTVNKVKSQKARKELVKEAYRLLLKSRVSETEMQDILKEVDELAYIPADPEELRKDVEQEILSRRDAAKFNQYPNDTVKLALDEKEERAKIVAEAQSSAAINVDNPADKNLNNDAEQKQQSRDTALRSDTKDMTRGEGK